MPRYRFDLPRYQQAGQPALSYKHNENFKRTKVMGQASLLKAASPANRAASPHINRSEVTKSLASN